MSDALSERSRYSFGYFISDLDLGIYSDPDDSRIAMFSSGTISPATTRTFTFPDASGTLALTTNLASYVPYTGATGDVDLNTRNLTTTGTLTANILKTTGAGTIWSDGTTGTTPTSGAGTRLMWIPALKAFRAGGVTGTYWDAANIAPYSFACGLDTKASGYAASAFGDGTIASGDYSTAFGIVTLASGQAANAFGYYTTANDTGCLAIGYNNNSNNTSFIAGDAGGTKEGAIAIGTATAGQTFIIGGLYSMGFGVNINVSADYAFAFGSSFTNSTASSFGIGFGQLDYLFTATAADFYNSSITTSGAVTFSALNVAGFVKNSAAGLLSTSTLPITAPDGGTGQTVYAVGDLLYASTTTVLSKLADVDEGRYLRSGGVTTAPLWSTLILPNAATINQIVYATSANTWGASSAFTFDGSILTATLCKLVMTGIAGVGAAAAPDTLNIIGGASGGTTLSVGANIVIKGGAGTTINSASAGTTGGGFNLTSGVGGVNSGAGIGGTAGVFALIGGIGGYSGTGNGGDGGGFSLQGGAGGIGSNTSGTGNGGGGGTVLIASGAGADSYDSGNGGNGGSITIRTGAGGSGVVSGSYGNLFLMTTGGLAMVGSTATPTAQVDIINSTAAVTALRASKNVSAVSANLAVADFVQDHLTAACEVIRLQQDDASEEFIDFVGTDGGATGADSGKSIIVALSGVKYKLKLYATA